MLFIRALFSRRNLSMLFFFLSIVVVLFQFLFCLLFVLLICLLLFRTLIFVFFPFNKSSCLSPSSSSSSSSTSIPSVGVCMCVYVCMWGNVIFFSTIYIRWMLRKIDYESSNCFMQNECGIIIFYGSAFNHFVTVRKLIILQTWLHWNENWNTWKTAMYFLFFIMSLCRERAVTTSTNCLFQLSA